MADITPTDPVAANPADTISVTNNLVFGIIANCVIAVLAFLVGWRIGQAVFSGTLILSCGTALSILSLWYFGWEGLAKVPVGHRGLALLIGKRQTNPVLDEGWIWYWPAPIGAVEAVDCRRRKIEQEVTEVLSQDKKPVKINTASEVRTVNPLLFVGVESGSADDLYRDRVDQITRLIAAKIEAEDLTESKIALTHVLENGTRKGAAIKGLEEKIKRPEDLKELERLELKGMLDYALRNWGIEVLEIRVTDVRLPKEIEAAKVQISVEQAQKQAEAIEIENLNALVRSVRKAHPKLSTQEAVAAVQAERGKRTVINIEGTANPLVQAGTLAGLGNTLTKKGEK